MVVVTEFVDLDAEIASPTANKHRRNERRREESREEETQEGATSTTLTFETSL